MYIFMTKIISISDKAYNELSSLKNGFSFSQVILLLTRMKKKESIMNFAGLLNEDEGEKIKKEIRKDRENISRRML